MKKELTDAIAWAFIVLLAMSLPAAAQPPPRNHVISNIWSSANGELYQLDLLTSRSFDELAPLRLSSLINGPSDLRSQDILTCEPQTNVLIGP
jgi:hypothetical protein